jgi:DNA segregation ATPase FtsK/SpoIIIE-like protein
MYYPEKKGYHNWDVSKRPTYKYLLFNERHRNAGIFSQKLFPHAGVCKPEYYHALTNATPEGTLPVMLGTRNGKTHVIDWLHYNTLVAGASRTGKTCFLQNILLSMMYWCSPEFLKVICIDTKGASYKGIRPIASVYTEAEPAFEALKKINNELQKRIAYTSLPGTSADAEVANEIAFSRQQRHLVMPYVLVLIDEVKDLQSKLGDIDKEKEYQLNCMLQTLSSTGLGLGFSLTFATQSPYVEVVSGMIKNNFERRISFALGDATCAQTILGKRPEPHMVEELGGTKGDFIHREGGYWRKYNSVHMGEKNLDTFAQCSKTLKRWGFDFTPDFL